MLATLEDFAALLPADLPDSFDSGELAKAIHQQRPLAQKMAYCLRAMGVIQVTAKRGKALLYSRVIDEISANPLEDKNVDLAELIRSRRSIGLFNDAPVPLELVHELLESAVYAPNHRLTEPWRFVVLTGAGRERYAEIRRDMVLDFMKGQGEAERKQAAEGTYRKFMNVPLYLLVVMRKQANAELDEEDYAACCCVIQNFLLLAWERGLGRPGRRSRTIRACANIWGLSETERVVGIVHVGYSAEEERTGQRKPAH